MKERRVGRARTASAIRLVATMTWPWSSPATFQFFLQVLKMPPPKDDPKSSEWRPYIFARDQWHCRICGDRFQYSETVRKHIADAHDENVPPSMYEYFRGAVWQRKKIPCS